MRLLGHPWRLARLRHAAHCYADHGWPVVPGATLIDSRFTCGPGCPTVACHPGIDRWEGAASTDHAQVALWWRQSPRAVLLATGRVFDAVDLPEWLGRATMDRAPAGGPVLVTPTGRWLFLVRHGDLTLPELAAHFDVVVHAAGSWLPAPPTALAEGRVRWRVSPEQTGWDLACSAIVQAHAVAALRAQAGPATDGTTAHATPTAPASATPTPPAEAPLTPPARTPDRGAGAAATPVPPRAAGHAPYPHGAVDRVSAARHNTGPAATRGRTLARAIQHRP